jgi:phosphopantetheinyl transferase
VACAISDADCLGVDIEVHSPHRNFGAIAAAAFGPSEQSQVAALGLYGFYRIWTLREAMAKASGTGIAEVTDRTDRIAGRPKDKSWITRVGETLWWLSYCTPATGLSFALAAKSPRLPATAFAGHGMICGKI